MTARRERTRQHLLVRLAIALGPKALLTWSLLFFAMLSLVAGLADVVPAVNTGLLVSIAFAAMTLGWLLAQLPMSPQLAAGISAVFGVEFVLLRVGQLGDEMFAVVRAGAVLVRDLVLWYWNGPPDWGEFPGVLFTLWRDFGILLRRGLDWALSLLSGSGAVFDPVAVALVWSLIVWLCAVWAGWVIRRHHRPLLGVLPGGILLTSLLSYSRVNPLALLPLVGLTLLLMALMQQRAREFQWSITGVDFSRDLWGDILSVASAVTLFLVAAAALAPSVSAQKVVDWINELRPSRHDETTPSETVAESLGIERVPETREPTTVELVARTSLPRRHLVGSGPELRRIVTMLVFTGELPPFLDATVIEQKVPRYYWRSLTYDIYFGSGWATSHTESAEYEAGENAIWPDVPHRRMMRQRIQVVSDMGGMVHVAGQLVSVDQPYEIAWRPPGEIFAATTEGETYRADSILPVVTEEELREAGIRYPTWILDRYLQLPDDTPERVLALARDLTATEPTPYDRALAIESYLRQFPYTLDVPTPSVGQDIADYFLFDLQEGYCDYYATSMVVLARAAGLPARMVIGYLNGTYDARNARYIVTEADAHAWAEVYFPEYGWIEFEPTGGYPALDRSPEEEEPIIWPTRQEMEPLVPPEPKSDSPVWPWIVVPLAALVAALLLASLLDALLLLRFADARLLSRLYRRLRKHGTRLQVPAPAGATPYEFTQRFERHLHAIAQDRGGNKLISRAGPDVRALAEAYVRQWYAAEAALDAQTRRKIVWTWWRLRWRLWYARLRRRRRKERAPMPSGPQARPGDNIVRPTAQPM